jgi:formate dehydrogenase subunit delta
MKTRDMLRMANQIAAFFKPYPRAQAVSDAAAHINNYWTKPMRAELLAHVKGGGKDLDPLMIEAATQIRRPAESVEQPANQADIHPTGESEA